MNASRHCCDRKQLAWPAAGLCAGVLVSLMPLQTGVPLFVGIAAWCITTFLVLVFSGQPIGARIAAFVAGLFPAIACSVAATPLARGLLVCFAAVPLGAAAALVVVPARLNIRSRLAYLFTWRGTRSIKACPPRFDSAAFLNLVVATVVAAVAMTLTKAATALSIYPVRWLSGGVLILAFAEMVTAAARFTATAVGLQIPQWFQSPHLSTSINEFWTRRWNIFTSQMIFRPLCFAPLARRSIPAALVATFVVSGLGHMLLVYVLLGKWGISWLCGAFFFVQPLLIAAERTMTLRQWPRPAAHAWTICALAMTSPLFSEPVLQIVEKSWGSPDSVFSPTFCVFLAVLIMSSAIALGSLTARPSMAREDVLRVKLV